MIVMIVYIVLVAIGEVTAFMVCQALDNYIPSAWSMIVYMISFFGVIWAAWPLAVLITDKWFVSDATAHPKAAKTAK